MATHSLGKGHRQLADAEAALRAGHLRLMARLAAPVGEAVLVTDVVSSQMLAALPALPAEALAGLLTRLGLTGVTASPQPETGRSRSRTRGRRAR
jgi:hypothetical protein